MVFAPGDENLKVPNRISKNPLRAEKLSDVISSEKGAPLIVSNFKTKVPKLEVPPVPLMV